jgi:para-aminobenzoate synthetase component I
MQREQKSFSVKSMDEFKSKLLIWAQQFETISWLDSNQYHQKYSSFDAVLAVEEFTSIKTDYTNAFDKLKEYQSITDTLLVYQKHWCNLF